MLKDNLFYERLELSKLRKSASWTEENLEKVLKSLKPKKSADPAGLINELFRPEVAGSDVNCSLLVLSNKAKDECEIPDFVQSTNISSIYTRGEAVAMIWIMIEGFLMYHQSDLS